MRTRSFAGLLLVLCACDDGTPEVQEADAYPASAEAATDAGEAGPLVEPVVDPLGEAEQLPGEPVAEPPSDSVTVELIEAGSGAAARRGSTVRVHYEAWLATVHAEGGEPFDSSISRLVPLELELGGTHGVIEGLWRGLLGLREGSRARLLVPAALGWGTAGNEAAGVPADSDLVYEVRVVSVR